MLLSSFFARKEHVFISGASALLMAGVSLSTGCDESGTTRVVPVSTEVQSGRILTVAKATDQAIDTEQAVEEGQVDFARDIRPILSDRCFACHGPDAASSDKLGGFRLDSFEHATKEADSGRVPIVPGDPENSELIRRINAKDKPGVLMPPPDSHLKLTDEEIQKLTQWIEQGAAYTGHWAYESPIKSDLPKIEHTDWARNAIDFFIADELEKAGLSPSDPADKATLIRRLSLDLIGLPPTPSEIDAFLNDDSDNAYEKVVERLLASPHFGERIAIVWLDAARYGDTNGFHHDNIRNSWPYREWVINAFNQNMPYDQFVIEQLAGDMLPNATDEQRLASGFCRMHNINDEGGALDEEYRVEAIADRIETISTVFMAQTFTCARCHDHKYDPISQEDYFSLYAYFNSVEERGVYRNNFQDALAYPARMDYMAPSIKKEIDALQPELVKAIAERDANSERVAREQEAWEHALRERLNIHWAATSIQEAKSSNAATTATTQPDGSVLLGGKPADFEDVTVVLRTDLTGLRLLKLDALTDPSFKDKLGIAPNGNAVLSHIKVKAVSVADPGQTQDVKLTRAWADHEQANGDFDVFNALRDDKLGWAVDGHGKPGPRMAMFVADKPFGYEGGTELHVTLHYRSEYANHTLGRVRLQAAAASDAVLEQFHAEDAATALSPVALVPSQHRTEAQNIAFSQAWQSQHSPTYRAANQKVVDIEAQIAALREQAVPVVVMKELDEPVQMYILERGAYDGANKDKPVSRRPPASLGAGPLPEGVPNNRLGFARWLVQPDHPLTSRVHVNRLWQMFFGTGIVKTAEDFGSQADWPSHPELLDYLAVDFVESGWDQKALIKKIVMSATYRQKAKTRSETIESDPNNRLLSYFPRQRLIGELIRDQALFVSGLLNDEIGGPSVKPYQPGNLWNEVAIGNSNTMNFKRDEGDALYRRSMYTFWKKTSPPAQMAAFNAPTREFCVVQRDVTNTPMQTLVLWNDEQFLEAARALAQRTLKENAGKPIEAGLSEMFRRCTGRTPGDRTMIVLRDTLQHFKQRYGTSEQGIADAKELLKQGDSPLPEKYDPAELAAWMMTANTILSLDETIVRD